MNTPHLIEIALLMLAAFLIGCVIGFFLRNVIGLFLRKTVRGESNPDTTSTQDTASTVGARDTGEAKMADAPSTSASEKLTETAPKAEAAKPDASTSSKATTSSTTATAPAKKPAAKSTAKKSSTAKTTTAKKVPAKTSAKKPAATKAASTASKAKSTSAAAAKKPAAAAKKPATKKAAPAKSAAAATEGKPQTLQAPRAGGKDDLKNIKGVGPKIESILNDMGIFHFDQVASWGRKEVKWVDEELSFKGRIDREKWIAQAKKLAKDAAK